MTNKLDQNIKALALGKKNGDIDSRLRTNINSILTETIVFKESDEPLNKFSEDLQKKYTVLNPDVDSEPLYSDSMNDFRPSQQQQPSTSSNNNGSRSNLVSNLSFVNDQQEPQFPSVPVAGGSSKKQQSHQTYAPSSSSTATDHRKLNDGIPAPQSDLYPYDVELDWKSVQEKVKIMNCVGLGLRNEGNTCFLNSVLQVLTHTAPLIYFLLQHHSQCYMKMNNFCGICELKDHIYVALIASDHRRNNSFYIEPISPVRIIKRMRCFMKSYIRGRQEDAHEFLRYFMDNMQTLSVVAKKGQKLDMFTKSTTPIGKIFGGYHRNEITCMACQYKSTTYDPFLDISLEIKRQNNVEDALKNFTKVELLLNENAYNCEKCKKRVKARKQFTIHRAPNILTIQLKRFSSFAKIGNFVHYPETLNLRPFMSEPIGAKVLYRLYGAIVHQGGSSNSGHYFAYVKNLKDAWHIMDDSKVSPAAQRDVLQQPAYLLFYSKVIQQTAIVKPRVSSNGISPPDRVGTGRNTTLVSSNKPQQQQFTNQHSNMSVSSNVLKPGQRPLHVVGPMKPSGVTAEKSKLSSHSPIKMVVKRPNAFLNKNGLGVLPKQSSSSGVGRENVNNNKPKSLVPYDVDEDESNEGSSSETPNSAATQRSSPGRKQAQQESSKHGDSGEDNVFTNLNKSLQLAPNNDKSGNGGKRSPKASDLYSGLPSPTKESSTRNNKHQSSPSQNTKKNKNRRSVSQSPPISPENSEVAEKTKKKRKRKRNRGASGDVESNASSDGSSETSSNSAGSSGTVKKLKRNESSADHPSTSQKYNSSFDSGVFTAGSQSSMEETSGKASGIKLKLNLREGTVSLTDSVDDSLRELKQQKEERSRSGQHDTGCAVATSNIFDSLSSESLTREDSSRKESSSTQKSDRSETASEQSHKKHKKHKKKDKKKKKKKAKEADTGWQMAEEDEAVVKKNKKKKKKRKAVSPENRNSSEDSTVEERRKKKKKRKKSSVSSKDSLESISDDDETERRRNDVHQYNNGSQPQQPTPPESDKDDGSPAQKRPHLSNSSSPPASHQHSTNSSPPDGSSQHQHPTLSYSSSAVFNDHHYLAPSTNHNASPSFKTEEDASSGSSGGNKSKNIDHNNHHYSQQQESSAHHHHQHHNYASSNSGGHQNHHQKNGVRKYSVDHDGRSSSADNNNSINNPTSHTSKNMFNPHTSLKYNMGGSGGVGQIQRGGKMGTGGYGPSVKSWSGGESVLNKEEEEEERIRKRFDAASENSYNNVDEEDPRDSNGFYRQKQMYNNNSKWQSNARKRSWNNSNSFTGLNPFQKQQDRRTNRGGYNNDRRGYNNNNNYGRYGGGHGSRKY